MDLIEKSILLLSGGGSGGQVFNMSLFMSFLSIKIKKQ